MHLVDDPGVGWHLPDEQARVVHALGSVHHEQ